MNTPAQCGVIKPPKTDIYSEAPQVRQADIDDGDAAGITTADRGRIWELESENRELRRANAILRSASAFFAAELDGPLA